MPDGSGLPPIDPQDLDVLSIPDVTTPLPDLDIPVHGPDATAIPSFWDAMFLWDNAVIVATLSGMTLAWLGIWVLLSRAAFVSAAVSQLAGLGVVLGLLVPAACGIHLLHPEGMAHVAGILLGVLGAGLFALPRQLHRTSTDALLALAVIGASALTLVGAALMTLEYQHIKDALYGDAVVASGWEVQVTVAVAAMVLVLHVLWRHRFALVLFDPGMASAQGLRVRVWSLLLGLKISIAIAAATASIGALAAFAFVVVPAMAALLVTQRLNVAFVISASLAAVAAMLGYYLSFVHSLPTGPTMVAVLLAGLIPASLYRLLAR